MKQVQPNRHWPSGTGWTFAILKQTPEELSESIGILFQSESDGLGELQLAAIGTDQAGQLWFLSHLQAPSKGTEMQVDSHVTRSAAMEALRSETGLAEPDCLWLSPDEVAPERAIASGATSRR